MDLAEFAIEMIKKLTEPDVWAELAKSEATPPTQVRATLPAGRYDTIAEVYRLYAPLSVIRTLSRSLTQFDLSLEPKIELQYYLATRVYASFKDDHELAKLEPEIHYTPFAERWREQREIAPQTYWWQGLTMGRLEGILDLMSTSVGGSQTRVITFGEFERLYVEIFDDVDESRRKSVAAAANALHRFRPSDRPVFWRMLATDRACTSSPTLVRSGGDSRRPSAYLHRICTPAPERLTNGSGFSCVDRLLRAGTNYPAVYSPITSRVV